MMPGTCASLAPRSRSVQLVAAVGVYLYMRYCLVASLNAYADLYSRSMSTSGSSPLSSASRTDGDPNLRSKPRFRIVSLLPAVLLIAHNRLAPTRAACRLLRL